MVGAGHGFSPILSARMMFWRATGRAFSLFNYRAHNRTSCGTSNCVSHMLVHANSSVTLLLQIRRADKVALPPDCNRLNVEILGVR
jgi:hypothetical protein